MKKILRIALQVLLLLLLPILFPKNTLAINNPTEVANNKFGIHVIDENDFEDATNLVNSSGGDWGYVKLVMEEKDRDGQKWQRIFDRLRELHLIPIIRLATTPSTNFWEKPGIEDAKSWANFLSSLNWVTQNRYVVIFNEPNHAKEWGGELNPEEYARVLRAFSETLKSKSSDYFILNAGLDASAPSVTGQTMDEAEFLRRMRETDESIFEVIDGFSSHSYPNPAFSGSPTASGKGTVRTYLWERNFLRSLGVTKELPIFITETGWSRNNLSEEKISEYFTYAFQNIWASPEIVAVTPFVINYQEGLFDEFSWRKKEGENEEEKFYKWYEDIRLLEKERGSPIQDHGVVVIKKLPEKLVQESIHRFNLVFRNEGQAIWDSSDGYEIAIESTGAVIEKPNVSFRVKPSEELYLPVILETAGTSADYRVNIFLKKNGETKATLLSQPLSVVSPLKLNFTAKSLFMEETKGADFTLRVLDEKEEILKFSNVSVSEGVGNIPEIHNLVPGSEYIFELSKKYYLPTRKRASLDVGDNTIRFGLIFPYDFNGDGRLNLKDLYQITFHPLLTFKTLLPEIGYF